MKRLVLVLGLLLFSSELGYGSTLIGGRQVNPGEYPEVINIRSGRSSCTASVIGPRVILTAAHCTKPGGVIVPLSENLFYEFQLDQMIYKARCKIAPHYKQQTGDQDMALCKTDRKIDVKYASLSKEGPKLMEIVTLIGYGCIRQGGGGGNDGILRIGEARVIKESNLEWYSFHTKGNSALCFGDSGGPSFKQVFDPKHEHHYIYGVNSRGDIKELSMLTAVYHPESLKFARDFERDQKVKICGLSLNCDKGGKEPRTCAYELELVKDSVSSLDKCLSKE